MSEKVTTLDELINVIPKESLLMRIYQYAYDRTKAPKEIVFCSTLALLGASLKDRIYFDWAVKPIFPNFPLLIVAPSGYGKTGAINCLMDIFEGALPNKIPEDATAESMTKEFALSGTVSTLSTSAIWIVPEMADIFGRKKYQEGIVPRITRLLDAPKNRKISRMTGEPLTIEGYALLNWITCTTVNWLVDHVEESMATGGFLPRLFIIHSSENPRQNSDPQKNRTIENQLNSELKKRILAEKKGALSVGTELKHQLELNYGRYLTSLGTLTENVAARRDENFLRLYLVLKVFSDVTELGQLLSLSYGFCNFFEYQYLTLNKYIKNNKNRNNLFTQENYLRVMKKFRKSEKEVYAYAKVCRDLGLHSNELKNILKDMAEKCYIVWDGKAGEDGFVVINRVVLSTESEG